MYNLISWYNRNRKKVWSTILAVGIISLIVWRLINSLSDNSIKQPEVGTNSSITANTFNSIAVSSQRSAVTGTTANIKKNEVEVIDTFVEYCNSGKFQEAYSLISNECKEEMFPSIDNFSSIYLKKVFSNGKKNASVENWVGDIYRVKFTDDLLSTGKYTNSNTLQDYITLTKDKDGNTKLNINGYIKRTELNKTESTKNIDFKIIKKDSYMDYELYTIEVKNNNMEAISLGDVKNIEMSYLVDENNIQYNIYAHELAQNQVMIMGKQTKTFKLKYFNEYSSTRNIKSLIFPNVILNFEEYQKLHNKNTYTNYLKVIFNM